MNRGDRCEAIFVDDINRQLLIETLQEACEKTDFNFQLPPEPSRPAKVLRLGNGMLRPCNASPVQNPSVKCKHPVSRINPTGG